MMTTSSSQAVASHLDQLSRTFISAINSRQLDTAEALETAADDNFEGHIPGAPVAYSFRDHVNTYRQLILNQPDLQIRIIDTSSQVDEATGFANSYVYVEVTGGGLKNQGVSVITWRRRDGKWLCMKHTILKGLENIV